MSTSPPGDGQLVGGYFVIVYLSLILYGIVVAQTYAYALHAKDDPTSLKITAGIIALCETIHIGLMMHSTYLYSVLDFGHPQLLGLIPWSAGPSVMLGMVITGCVQTYYIRRIYVMSEKNWWLTGLVSIMLFARAPFSFAAGGLMLSLGTWSAFRIQIGPLIAVCLGLGLSAAVDVTITSILIFYLYKARTGFKSTDRVIHTLMAYTINSGFITMICSTLSVVTFVVLPSSLVFAGLVQMSSKLYANSFLGTLNARQRLRKRSNNPSILNRPVSDSVTLSTRFSIGTKPQIEVYQITSALHNPASSRELYSTGVDTEDIEMNGSFSKGAS
ncbi:hypothetical protein BXZ70DRAFT_1006099 [Cristinia sonorae]|uniref:DUF6534 domain-containing protein n=1 Tax=Cristinia sonorae TaxID=1940300 RepID=A0A8K0URV1_9AGAR|nr:hypothetical protein BXZ70DRAFT_1006099 [Cristinia sonorae]